MQYNRYIKNDLNNEVQVGIEAIGLVVEKSNYLSENRIDKTIYVGYKVIVRDGFTCNVQYG